MNMGKKQFGEKIKIANFLTLIIVILMNFVQIALLDVTGMQQELVDVVHLPSQEHVKLLDIIQILFVLIKIIN